MIDVQISSEGRHYESRWVDMIPVIGFFPHVKRIRRYMEGIRSGEYGFPENAGFESAKRFAITTYHGLSAGFLLGAGLERLF